MTSEEIVKRIKECEAVIESIDNTLCWQIIQKDMILQANYIDNNWHLANEGQLNELRISKFVVDYILKLKEKYLGDLEYAKGELLKLSTFEEENIQVEQD